MSGSTGWATFSATLLILRATQLLHAHGRSDTAAAAVAVLLYAAHNAANAAFAYPAGIAGDRLGRRPVLVAGVGLFGVACAAFALGSANLAVLGMLFVALGASTALVETGQGAHSAELLDPAIGGRGLRAAWPGRRHRRSRLQRRRRCAVHRDQPGVGLRLRRRPGRGSDGGAPRQARRSVAMTRYGQVESLPIDPDLAPAHSAELITPSHTQNRTVLRLDPVPERMLRYSERPGSSMLRARCSRSRRSRTLAMSSCSSALVAARASPRPMASSRSSSSARMGSSSR